MAPRAAKPFLLLRLPSLGDHARRDAHGDSRFGNVLNHDSIGADDRVVPDLDRAKNPRTRTQLNAATNLRRFLSEQREATGWKMMQFGPICARG